MPTILGVCFAMNSLQFAWLEKSLATCCTVMPSRFAFSWISFQTAPPRGSPTVRESNGQETVRESDGQVTFGGACGGRAVGVRWACRGRRDSLGWLSGVILHERETKRIVSGWS